MKARNSKKSKWGDIKMGDEIRYDVTDEERAEVDEACNDWLCGRSVEEAIYYEKVFKRVYNCEPTHENLQKIAEWREKHGK